MRPQKAQVKDKGLWAESWDLGAPLADVSDLSFSRSCKAGQRHPYKFCEYSAAYKRFESMRVLICALGVTRGW